MPLEQDTTLRLISLHGAALLALARQWTDDGEDLVQEAFCKLMTAEPKPDNPAAWLFQVVRNDAKKKHRANTRRTSREKQVAKTTATQLPPDQSVHQSEALAAMNGLPTELRELVIMRLWGELTLEEIAGACQISIATAHRQYKKAISMIQKELGVHTN